MGLRGSDALDVIAPSPQPLLAGLKRTCDRSRASRVWSQVLCFHVSGAWSVRFAMGDCFSSVADYFLDAPSEEPSATAHIILKRGGCKEASPLPCP